MPTHQLAYLIFGRDSAFLEGRYAIVAAAARAAGPVDVVVCTDRPEAFAGWPVRVLHLTPELDAEWRGENGFLFRIKPCFLLAVIDDADKTVLIDGDTLFTVDPAAVFDKIGPGDTVMHDDEGAMRDSDSHWKSGQDVVAGVASAAAGGTIALPNGGEVAFDVGQHMWNAGVVGVGREHRSLIEGALRVTDVIDAASPWLFAEQFAFSVMLDKHTRLHDAREEVEHYWSRINYPGWNQAKPKRTLYQEQATAFFAAHAGHSFEQLVAAFRRRPPALFRIPLVRQKIAAVLRRTVARQYSPAAARAGKLAEAEALATASKAERSARADRAAKAAARQAGL